MAPSVTPVSRTPFGGALALAYYAEPRMTVDVDVNVFVPPREHATVMGALLPLGVEIRNGTPGDAAVGPADPRTTRFEELVRRSPPGTG